MEILLVGVAVTETMLPLAISGVAVCVVEQLPSRVREIYPVGFELVMCTFERYHSVRSS